MRVDHQTNIRTNGSTHLPHRLQIRIRPSRRPHFVGRKPHPGYRHSLLRESLRLHVHTRTPVKLDPVPLGPAHDVTQRTPLETSHQIHHGNLHGPIRLGQFQVSFEIKACPSAGIAPLQERRDNLTNLPLSPLMRRSRGKPLKPVVRCDTNEHRVPLQHGSHTAIKRQHQRLRQWAGNQKSLNTIDFHVIICLAKRLAKNGKPQPKQGPSLGQARQDTKTQLSYRSQSIHRQLAHPSKYVFHSYPDLASQFVSLLVLFA